jgi:PAS domain S-box-containing protein
MAKKPTYEELEQGVSELKKEVSQLKQTEKVLEQNEEKYRGLVENSFDGIFVQKGPTIIFTNQRLNEMLGYKKDELVGLDHWLVYHPDYQELTRERAKARMRGEMVTPQYEVKLQRKDGSWLFGEINARAISFEEEPEVQVWVRDITERKQAEDTLKESEERYRTILESIEEGYFEVDLTGTLTFFNDALCKITGYTRGELLGINNREYTTQETAKKMYQTFNHVYRTGKPLRVMDYEIIIKDGRKMVIEMSTSLMRDPSGAPIGFRGVIRDITSRKQAEDALRESEEKYRTILESIEEGYYELDIAGNFTFFNDSICKIFGYANDELMGMNNREYTEKETAKRLYQTFNRVYETGKSTRIFDFEIIRKDTTKRYVEASVSLIKDSEGNPAGFRGIVRDITERKRSEEELKTRQTYLESVLYSAPDAIVTLDASHLVLEWNIGAEQIFGYTRHEAVGKNLDDLVTGPDMIDESKELTTQVLSGDKVLPRETVRCRKDGTPVNVIVAGSPIIIRDKLQGVVAVYTDITERKQAEEALKESEERFRVLVEESPLGVVLIAKDGYYKYINPKFIEMFGYTMEDIPTGRVWFKKAYPDKEYRDKVISAWMSDLNESKGGEHL